MSAAVCVRECVCETWLCLLGGLRDKPSFTIHCHAAFGDLTSLEPSVFPQLCFDRDYKQEVPLWSVFSRMYRFAKGQQFLEGDLSKQQKVLCQWSDFFFLTVSDYVFWIYVTLPPLWDCLILSSGRHGALTSDQLWLCSIRNWDKPLTFPKRATLSEVTGRQT